MREKIIDLLYAENVRSDCGIERLADEICAIDAVEVVRCKDCRWREQEQPGMVYCPCIVGGWVEDDWFCAGGERREG